MSILTKGDALVTALTGYGTAVDQKTDGLGTAKEPKIIAGTTGQYWRGDKTWQTLNKTAVGLANVDNTSDANKPVSTATSTALNLKIDKSSIGAVNGVASLDASGKVLAIQLPSFVDDVLEYPTLANFPGAGESGKIYVAANDGTAANPSRSYRWSGTVYIPIDPSPGSTDGIAEGTVNLYFTEARARGVVLTGLSTATSAVISATDSTLSAFGKLQRQITDLNGSSGIGSKEPTITAGTTAQYWRGDKTWQTLNKTTIGLANVDNTSDANKPISTATQLALDGKENTIAAGTISQYWRGDKTWATMPTNLNQFTNGPGYITGITASMVTSALAYTPVRQNTSNIIQMGWSGTKLQVLVDSTAFGSTWPIDITGSAGSAASATYSNAASAQWVGAEINSSTAINVDTSSVQIKNAGGTGDAGVAAMAFNCVGSYALKLHLRADGYFGLGGWQRAAWSWYSDPNGNMVAAGDVTAYSDPRLKEGFERIQSPMAMLRQLDGGTFTWKAGIPHTAVKAGKRDYGILADQVAQVMPEICYESIELDGEKYWTVAYEKIVPVLIEAQKEADDKVQALTQQVTAQAQELTSLRQLVEELRAMVMSK